MENIFKLYVPKDIQDIIIDYKIQFEKLKCPICLEYIENIFYTSECCNNNFCKECIVNHREEHTNCPICETTFPEVCINIFQRIDISDWNFMADNIYIEFHNRTRFVLESTPIRCFYYKFHNEGSYTIIDSFFKDFYKSIHKQGGTYNRGDGILRIDNGFTAGISNIYCKYCKRTYKRNGWKSHINRQKHINNKTPQKQRRQQARQREQEQEQARQREQEQAQEREQLQRRWTEQDRIYNGKLTVIIN